MLALGDGLALAPTGIETGRIPPQPFEVVVVPGRVVEDVDDDVAVVEQHPLGVIFALPPEWFSAVETQRLLHPVDERLHLAASVPRGDHEDVGDDEELVHVEQDDIDSLLLVEGNRGSSGEGLSLCSDGDDCLSTVGDVAAHNDTDVDHSRTG